MSAKISQDKIDQWLTSGKGVVVVEQKLSELHNFLLDYGVLSEFITNCKDYLSISDDEVHQLIIDNSENKNVFNNTTNSFSWVKTPEGIPFWSDINKKWKKDFDKQKVNKTLQTE